MATAGLGRVIEHLRVALGPLQGEPLTDAQLLDRFVRSGDEASFTGLLARHGSMVLGVCRRVLRHEQDAEDAFQATFLVLAKKASSLRPQTLAAWLHEVASRTALEARTIQLRRRTRERQLTEFPHPQIGPPEFQDWRELLDREIARLPLKYRIALVLCELEGRSRQEAARHLQVPEGTLSSRLAKGKRLLAQKLSQLSLPGAALVWTGSLTIPVVPEALCGATVKSMLLTMAGLEVTSASPAVLLMKGVLKTMFLTKIKIASVVMLFAALGAGGVAYQTAGPASVQAQSTNRPADAETLRKENELLKLNLEVVLKEVRSLKSEIATLKAGAEKSFKTTRDRLWEEDIIIRMEQVAREREELRKRAQAEVEKDRALNDEKQKQIHDLQSRIKQLQRELQALQERLKAQEKSTGAQQLEVSALYSITRSQKPTDAQQLAEAIEALLKKPEDKATQEAVRKALQMLNKTPQQSTDKK